MPRFTSPEITSLWSRQRVAQIRVNVKGTRVVRASLEARAGRLIHISSLVAYGLNGGTVTEETPPRGPGNTINYVRSKVLAEREIRRGIGRGLHAGTGGFGFWGETDITRGSIALLSANL